MKKISEEDLIVVGNLIANLFVMGFALMAIGR